MHSFKNVILSVFITLFYSCNNNSQIETSNEVFGGCGQTNAIHGSISIFSQIDLTQYIVMIFTKELTTIKAGKFSLESEAMQVDNNLSNQVFILDFDTKEKKYDKITEDIKGYIFPCSDIVSSSHSPDTLKLNKGEINISVFDKNKPRERIYMIEIREAEFSNGDKTKIIKNYKSKKLLFIEGNAG